MLGVEEDGDFGEQTVGAVAGYQAKNGLAVDGKLGPQTARRLLRSAEEMPASSREPESSEVSQAPSTASAPGAETVSPAEAESAAETAPRPEAVPMDQAAPATDSNSAELASMFGDASDHEAGAEALVERSRAAVEIYPALVRQFIDHSPLSATEKTAALGRVSAQLARMELLLGTIYHENNKWEVRGYRGPKRSNRGRMIDYHTNKKALAWCTAFATSALRTMGGGNKKVVASGYRVMKPEGFGHEYSDTDEGGGSSVGTRSHGVARATGSGARQNPWLVLSAQLRESEPADRQQVTETFFEEQIRPQPGDLIVMRRDDSAPAGSFSQDDRSTANKNEGFESHTAVVERVSGTVVSFIEGNRGSKAAGRSFDLSKPGDAEEIIFVSRPDIASYSNDRAPVSGSTEVVTPEQLLEPVETITRQLVGIAADGGWIDGDTGHEDSAASFRRGHVGSGTR